MAVNISSYQLPDDVFDALAAGGGGVRAIRHLAAAQYSKHVLLIRGVLDAAENLGHPQAALARQAYELLATIQQQAPVEVDAVIRHPAVGAWAWRTLRALRGDLPMAGAEPGRFAALAAAAAVRSGTPCTLDVPVTNGAITLPSLGMATLSVHDSHAVVRCSAAGVAVFTTGGRVDVPRDPSTSGPRWRALPRLVADAAEMTIQLLIDDLDPFRMPASTNTAPPLSTEDIEWWRASLRAAWTLLVRYHCVAAEEIAATIRVLTPLVSSPNSQVGASSRETFGTVALSTPPDAQSFALTLCHELQHAKLAAVIDIVALTRPDDGRRWYAPWRADPRPIGGLLQGSYAFLGVSNFWNRQRWHEQGGAALHAHSEFVRWRAAAERVVTSLLSSGQLTPTGVRFVASMARTLRSWEDESVPPEALELAEGKAQRHLASWRLRNGDDPTAL